MLGKILKYTAYGVGGVAIGVGAIAAAPFTGGGSVVGAATLAGSLAGAGTIAAATGAAGASAGVYLCRRDDEKEEDYKKRIEKEEKEKEIALQKAAELTKIISDIKSLQAKKDFYTSLITFGFAIANADGRICEREEVELIKTAKELKDDFPEISGLLESIYQQKPNLSEAITTLQKVEPTKRNIIRDTLIVVAELDGEICEEENKFLIEFDKFKDMIAYKPSEG